MPRDEGKEEEGKGGEGKDDGDEAQDVDPLIEKFAAYCTADDFAAAVAEFCEARCGPFEGASLDDEQKLEWTEVYDDYVALVEHRLEAFCKEHGCEDRDLFKKMRAATSASLEADFVPAVVRNAEYTFFFKEMTRTAEARASRAAAADAAARHAGTGNVSGVWERSLQRHFD